MPLMRRGPGLVRGVARTAVIAGTASAVSGRVQRRQQERWAAEEQPAYAPEAQPVYAEPPPAAAEPTYAAELAQLAQLHEQGVITDEEFDAKKKQILGI